VSPEKKASLLINFTISISDSGSKVNLLGSVELDSHIKNLGGAVVDSRANTLKEFFLAFVADGRLARGSGLVVVNLRLATVVVTTVIGVIGIAAMFLGAAGMTRLFTTRVLAFIRTTVALFRGVGLIIIIICLNYIYTYYLQLFRMIIIIFNLIIY
jgi:hypothetical protein